MFNKVVLTSITISNNDIAVLPQSISKLEHLNSLDIENTQISEIPMDFLMHGKISKLFYLTWLSWKF
jgi:Leucine-rich repeat (LRR) protein